MTDPTIEDVLQMAQRANARVSELEETVAKLQDTNEDLADEVARLSLRLSEIDDNRAYDALTRDEKVGLVREHGFGRAVDGTGTARLDYNAIQWEVFDGEPSADHCYRLMRLAGEARGFEHRDPAGRSQHLFVEAEQAKMGAAFSSANNGVSEGVR